MPSSRRRSGNSAATGHQKTLPFSSNTRISKPTTASPSLKHAKEHSSTVSPPYRSPSIAVEISSSSQKKKKKKPSSPRSSLGAAAQEGPADVVDSRVVKPHPIAASSQSANVVREQARVQVHLPRSEEDKRAEALTEKDIRRYWEAEEAKRIAPNVHQEGLSMNEKILRHFDLSNQYGPCIGIARIKRWRRAQMLNLHPPIEVLAVLLNEEARGVAREKAYIDELLS
ncbi:hypothetical protein PRK78_002331 [Emydomyces testavorans]|uniref:DNA polymerase delta subunit 4 n=1 Tax=Emydomyces testavorans TaxID=2070801 RepID=A0AAF0IHP5_9EURO|nr:hypothetical protein PRK78_002331 [Emydomyces testavorans]